jgi:hypothetical protein
MAMLLVMGLLTDDVDQLASEFFWFTRPELVVLHVSDREKAGTLGSSVHAFPSSHGCLDSWTPKGQRALRQMVRPGHKFNPAAKLTSKADQPKVTPICLP